MSSSTTTQSESSNGYPPLAASSEQLHGGRDSLEMAVVAGGGDGGSDAGDGYVEIEQVNDEEGGGGAVHYVSHDGAHYLRGGSGEDGAGQHATSNGYGGSPSAPAQRVIVKHIAKRTMISFQQRAILEEFYQKGMTSASFQLDILHQSAADKTGLDVTVIKVSAVRVSRGGTRHV